MNITPVHRWFVTSALTLAFAVGGFATLARADAPLEPLERIELRLRPDERSVERMVLAPDGHIYGVMGHTYDPRGRFFRLDTQTREVRIVDALPEPMVQPADQLLEGEAIAWIWNETGETAYSLDDQGMMLRHTSGGAEEIGRVAGTRIRENVHQVSVAFVWGPDGKLYTAGREGHLFRYDPGDGELEELDAQLPHIRGRQWWASLDAAVVGPDGLIYGGTYDGYIFTYDTDTGELRNYGKPIRQHRVNGLAFRDGKLLGVAGEARGLARSFAFDPGTSTFTLSGLTMTREDFAPVSAVVTDGDGHIYLGTTGRLGNLYVHPSTRPGE